MAETGTLAALFALARELFTLLRLTLLSEREAGSVVGEVFTELLGGDGDEPALPELPRVIGMAVAKANGVLDGRSAGTGPARRRWGLVGKQQRAIDSLDRAERVLVALHLHYRLRGEQLAVAAHVPAAGVDERLASAMARFTAAGGSLDAHPMAHGRPQSPPSFAGMPMLEPPRGLRRSIAALAARRERRDRAVPLGEQAGADRMRAAAATTSETAGPGTATPGAAPVAGAVAAGGRPSRAISWLAAHVGRPVSHQVSAVRTSLVAALQPAARPLANAAQLLGIDGSALQRLVAALATVGVAIAFLPLDSIIASPPRDHPPTQAPSPSSSPSVTPSSLPSPSPSSGPGGEVPSPAPSTPTPAPPTPTPTPSPTPTPTRTPPPTSPPSGLTTIDGTALSSHLLGVSGVVGWLDSRHVQTLRLEPGQHTLWSPGSVAVPFTVSSVGTFDFDSRISYLSGSGTNTLSVVGVGFRVNATRLTATSFAIPSAGATLPTAKEQEVRLLPGPYSFSIGGSATTPIQFRLGANGILNFDPTIGYALGDGTNTLTVVGVAFRVNATRLTATFFSIPSTGATPATGKEQELRLLPGTYSFSIGGSATTPILFKLDADGILHLDPTIGYASGDGTNTLTVVGVAFRVNATRLTALHFGFPTTGATLPTATEQEVRLLPGTYGFSIGGGATTAIPFRLGADGILHFDPTIGYASGDGTNTLTVVGVAFRVNATRLTALSFGIPTMGVTLPAGKEQEVRLMPGPYSFSLGGATTPIPFRLDADGIVHFEPTIGYASGDGTDTLTVSGLAVTVDATHVSCPVFGLSPATSSIPAHPDAQHLHLVPGQYTFLSCSTGPSFPLVLTPDGTFDYDPALTFVTGRGTDTIAVT